MKRDIHYCLDLPRNRFRIFGTVFIQSLDVSFIYLCQFFVPDCRNNVMTYNTGIRIIGIAALCPFSDVILKPIAQKLTYFHTVIHYICSIGKLPHRNFSRIFGFLLCLKSGIHPCMLRAVHKLQDDTISKFVTVISFKHGLYIPVNIIL